MSSSRSSSRTRNPPPPFVTPDELRKAQADSRSAAKADPWTSRYVRGSMSNLTAPANSGGPSSASSRSPSPAAETIKTTLASNRGLGSAMPSSINRDLRSSNASSLASSHSSAMGGAGRSSISSVSSSSTATYSPFSAAADLSISSDYTSPTLEGQDGTLSKVVGSLIDPQESRKTWACSGCGVVFARDSTLYAAPPSSSPEAGMLRAKKSSAYFCRSCYTDRFSIGTCANHSCSKPVLGSTKQDGKFVRAGDAIWHGRCWRCLLCNRGGGPPPLGDDEPIMVGMDGLPTCEDCFGKRRPATAERERTVTKARPRSTTYVSTTPSEPVRYTVPAAPSSSTSGTRNGQSTATPSGPPQTFLSRGDTLKARPQSIDLGRPAYARGLSGASLNRFSQQNGQASGTVAELTKKFGSTVSISSSNATTPRMNMNGFQTPTLGQGLFSASSSTTIGPLTPSLATTPTMEACPTPKLTRNNSITGSPPKPRPLTASFSTERGFNLSAFNATGRGDEGTLRRSDSRSRSVSPVKRNAPLPHASADGPELDFRPVRSPTTVELEASRAMTNATRGVNGRTSPAKSTSSSRHTSPERPTEVKEKEADEQDDAMRCAVCGLGAFDGPNQSSDDAVLVTLRQGVQLHAECLQCSICSGTIDPQRTFIRLDDPGHAPLAPGLGAFAHPKCAPSVIIKRPEPGQSRAGSGKRKQRGRSTDMSDDEHPTHQRAPRPSQETLPPPSSVAANKTILDFSTNSGAATARQLANGIPDSPKRGQGAKTMSTTSAGGGGVNLRPSGLPGGSADRFEWNADASLRRFQPSMGAAPPTRSSLNVTTRGVPAALAGTQDHRGPPAGPPPSTAGPGLSAQRNPAAGIFARRMAEINSKTQQSGGSAASTGGGGVIPGLPNAGTPAARFGGMPTCAGCNTKLSMLESVPGPRGTSWHSACLICGGDRSESASSHTASLPSGISPFGSLSNHQPSAAAAAGATARRTKTLPLPSPVLCGKRLDSGAKVNLDGRVRCRECYDREVALRRAAAASPSGTGTESSRGFPGLAT
ncbi:hypothetical protein V8E36_007336 [Tilletia maclaganii]